MNTHFIVGEPMREGLISGGHRIKKEAPLFLHKDNIIIKLLLFT
jgi:hypothetical protein